MEQVIISIAFGYITVMSVVGFTSMGVDKRRAVKKAWRIPERTLILIAFLGGGIGSFLGMKVFRHKTKHTKFLLSLPLAAVIYVLLLIMLYRIR